MGHEEYVEARQDHGRQYTAGIKRRPLALQACERRAYQEAKQLYKGAVINADGEYNTPPAPTPAPQRPFADRVVDSMHKQSEGPSA